MINFEIKEWLLYMSLFGCLWGVICRRFCGRFEEWLFQSKLTGWFQGLILIFSRWFWHHSILIEEHFSKMVQKCRFNWENNEIELFLLFDNWLRNGVIWESFLDVFVAQIIDFLQIARDWQKMMKPDTVSIVPLINGYKTRPNSPFSVVAFWSYFRGYIYIWIYIYMDIYVRLK